MEGIHSHFSKSHMEDEIFFVRYKWCIYSRTQQWNLFLHCSKLLKSIKIYIAALVWCFRVLNFVPYVILKECVAFPHFFNGDFGTTHFTVTWHYIAVTPNCTTTTTTKGIFSISNLFSWSKCWKTKKIKLSLSFPKFVSFYHFSVPEGYRIFQIFFFIIAY